MTSTQAPMKPSVCSTKRDRGDDEDTPEDKAVKSQRSNAKPPLTLPVTPSRYDAPFPFYRRPAEVGRFSLDSQRCYHGDASQLHYYAPPPTEGPSPGFDLREGYRDRYVQRDESVHEGLEHLLQWVSQNRKQLQGAEEKGQLLNTDFVTWRGHLTKVLTTPYEKQDGWLLAVSLFRGTLYVSEVETESARRQREQRSEMLKELMYMGYKFEHYMCAELKKASEMPLQLFISSVNGGAANDTSHFGTKPLSRGIDIVFQNQHKMIKWWAQSFLPGVSRIVAGYRGPDGSVVGLETFETMKIFQLIREDPGCWKPAVCMNFCAAFLSFVKKVVTEDNPKLVHLFAWEPGHPVSFTVHRDSEYTFLPDWYVEALSMEKPPTPQIPD
ncbi:PREDICTED: decapping and exoribonuclease protein-like [Gekko japonicus]|uniref:Decapping nuclease n=1 Tax=Gekko japonicus TaxID=146911 RepID=A0ABM1JHK3_GEKJA|nr:PREDICTED: decapping and exoribonuclease protein-like [Gekko japonicus]